MEICSLSLRASLLYGHYVNCETKKLCTNLKATLWKTEIELCVVRAFKCSIRTCQTGLNRIYIITILFIWALLHKKYNKSKGCEMLKCHGLPNLCSTHHFKMGLTQIPIDHGTLLIACDVRLHVGFSSYPTFLGP